jgi:predicted benzoate:H+ symporter BenE
MLVLAITLWRRGVLAAAITFLVLSGGRALFDAVNALPNWIVVMLAGMALLGAGMSILIGRDRWSEWQERLLTWWDDAGNGALAH